MVFRYSVTAPFVIRRFIHMSWGFIFLFLHLYFPAVARWIFGGGFVAILLLDLLRHGQWFWPRLFRHWFGHLLKPAEAGGRLTGATWMLFTVAVLSWYFPFRPAATGIAILAFSDPLAALGGKFIPSPRIYQQKTLAGSFVFVICSFLLGWWIGSLSVGASFFLAFLTTMVEIFSPADLENAGIGLTAAGLAWLAKFFA